MRDFMTEIKTINAAETIAQRLGDAVFTVHVYEKLRKDYHLPSLSFARKHGIVKIASEEQFTIHRNGEEINAKRYFYEIDRNTYKEIMSFLNTRTGLKKHIKKCSWAMEENNGKIELLTKKNAEYAQFLSLMGQW